MTGDGKASLRVAPATKEAKIENKGGYDLVTCFDCERWKSLGAGTPAAGSFGYESSSAYAGL